MNIQYKYLEINIIIKDRLIINNNNINVLDISIKKNNNLIKLGNFYSDINISDNIEYFIDNLDTIMFNNYRYIGNNEEVLNYLSEHVYNNIAINDMYAEYALRENIDYKKYSRFFELYFCSHEITDNIRKIFLEKEGKKVLDYVFIDAAIKSEFNGSIGELRVKRDHELDVECFNSMNLKRIKLKEEIKLLNEIMDLINNLIESLENNCEITKKLNNLENELSTMYFFDKRKKSIKVEIFNLKSQLDVSKLTSLKLQLNEKFREYAIKYNDSYGLNELFKHIDLGNLLTIIKDIYKNKKALYEELNPKCSELKEKISNYEECDIDISDLYERLEGNKVKE